MSATYNRKLCCVSPDVPNGHKLSTEEYWNGEYLKSVRLDMLAGRPVTACDFCINFENSGGRSLRNKVNDEYNIEYLVEQTNEDGSLNIPPSFYDVRSTTCNLQCVTCDENHSSMHKKLSAKLNINKNEHEVDSEYESRLAQEIITGLENKTVKMLYWAGGEPMLIKMHWDVINRMSELYELEDYQDYIKSIQLFYNTNVTRVVYKGESIPKILSKFNTVIWASLDGVEETYNYCRDGGHWKRIYGNWIEYRKHLPNTGVAAVLSAPVLMDIDRYIDFLEAEQCDFFDHEYLPIGVNPLMDIRVYPDHLFNSIIDHAINRFESANLKQSWKDNSLTILRKYVDERNSVPSISFEDAKASIVERDSHLVYGETFGTLLSIIHPECAEWYDSIVTK